MALVSLRRLCTFLNSDEVENTSIHAGNHIALDNATVTWPARDLQVGEVQHRQPFTLTDMSLRIPPEAKFVLVCGHTGAGKVRIHPIIILSDSN
jgi:ABC-type multidrug transport system fused ATPase/permease subunit